jgi:hypothetical protein
MWGILGVKQAASMVALKISYAMDEVSARQLYGFGQFNL